MALILGTNGADTRIGTASGDFILVGLGNDVVSAGAGGDIVLAGSGDDTISGEAGNDSLAGDDGADLLDGGSGNDTLNGGQGNDTAEGGLGSDLLVGGAGSDVLSGGDGDDTLDGGADADSLVGGDGQDLLDGGSGNDTLSGGGGRDDLRGGAGDDLLVGGAGADTLNGGDGIDTASYAGSSTGVSVNLSTGRGTGGDAQGDRLSSIENLIGSALADTLVGSAAANILNGGAGADTVTGGAGNDVFVYGTGSGADRITDFVAGASLRDVIDLRTMTGISGLADVLARATQVGANTVINFGAGDTLTLQNVSRASLVANDFVFAPPAANLAPTAITLTNVVSTLPETTSTATRIKLADIGVTDDGVGTNALGLAGANAALFEIVGTALYLRAGVVLDAETAASFAVTVTVDDVSVGSTPDASTSFVLTVGNVNEAPVVSQALADQLATQGVAVNFAVPAETFTDVDGDTLTLAATLAGGAALPSWLSFDAATRTFTGTPGNAEVGTLDVTVTASDGALTASDTFTLAIGNANDAPVGAPTAVLANGTEDVIYTVTAAQLLAGFSDPDGDTLSVENLTASSGIVAPDGVGGFTVTLPLNVNGPVTLNYDVVDGNGGSVPAMQSFTVDPVNEAPVVSQALADQLATQGVAVNFAVPAETFTDVDGDTLTLAATLAGGAALPSWLSFDAATRTFTGTPGNAEVGTLDVTVTASDGALTASDTFTLAIGNVDDPSSGAIGVSASTVMKTEIANRPLSAADITNPTTQFYNSQNDHVYEFVNVDVRWDAAVLSASQSGLTGLSGYLVTITTAAEQAFVVSHMNLITVGWDANEIWIGASDRQAEGSWVWETGPEAGTPVTPYAGMSLPPYNFPTNYQTGADYATLTTTYNSSGAWLDLDQEWFKGGSRTWENSSIYSGQFYGNGYVVEYSGNVSAMQQVAYLNLAVDTSGFFEPDGFTGTLSFQWQQSSDGVSWTNVAGATQAAFEVPVASAASYYRVETSYTDGSGAEHAILSEYYSAPQESVFSIQNTTYEFLMLTRQDQFTSWATGDFDSNGDWVYTLADPNFANGLSITAKALEHTSTTISAASTALDRLSLVQTEFGQSAELADFDDLVFAYSLVGDDVINFIDLKETNLSNIPDYDGKWYNNEGPFVTYFGQTHTGDRSYFVSAHDGTVPISWLVHDSIDNHQIDLGSWYYDRQVLAMVTYDLQL